MASQTPTRNSPAAQTSTTQDDSPLWREAYSRLDPQLKVRYEVVVKSESQVPEEARLESQLEALVAVRKKRVEDRKWTYTWRGRPKEVRQQLDTVLDVIEKTAGLVSIGMNLAPVFASVPWTAVCVLLPFITGASKKHNEAFSALAEITDILARYRLVEQLQLDQASTSYKLFRTSIIDLYAKVFTLQAELANYLGKNTFSRFRINALDSGDWAGKRDELLKADQKCQSFGHIQTAEAQHTGFHSVLEALNTQKALIKEIKSNCRNRRDALMSIQSWISKINPWADDYEVRQKLGEHYLDTGRWLYETDQFKKWEESSQSVLILQGSIGTGKSSLMSVLLQHLLTASPSRLGFFYCSRQSSQQSHNTLYATDTNAVGHCLLRQLALLEDDLTVDPIVVEKYETRSRESEANLRLSPLSALEDLLVDIINQSSGAIIMIDALDESSSAGGLLSFLSHMIAKSSKLRLVLSARPGVEVTKLLKAPADATIAQIDVHEHTEADIKTLVHHEIFESERGLNSPGCGMTENQAQKLESLLLKRSSAMFRWLVLQLDLFISRDEYLKINYTKDFENRLLALERSSSDLPKTDKHLLWSAYDEVYLRNAGSNPDDPAIYQEYRAKDVQRILYWTLCAFRPLHITELLAALHEVQEESEDSSIDATGILRYGSNFIRLDVHEFVVFTHHSVREYLSDSLPIGKSPIRKSSLSDFHSTASFRCVSQAITRQLNGRDFEYIFKRSSGETTLDTYACTYWLNHFKNSSEESKARDALWKMMVHISASTYYHIPKGNMEYVMSYARAAKVTPASKIALGTDDLVKLLEEFLRKLGPQTTNWTLAVFVECVLGCLFIARQDFPISSTLEFALSCHEDFIRLLLHHGADPNDPKGQVFHSAARTGTPEIMGLLLRRLRDPKALLNKDDQGRTALEVALMEQKFGCADRLWNVIMEHDFLFAETYPSIAEEYSQSFGRVDRERPHRARDQQLLTSPKVKIHASICNECEKVLSESFTPAEDRLLRFSFRPNSTCKICSVYLERWRDFLPATEDSPGKPETTQENSIPVLTILPYCVEKLYRKETMNLWTITMREAESPMREYTTELEICHGPARCTSFAAHFRSRDLCSEPFARDAVDTISHWMRDCDLHPECQPQQIFTTPRTVLDVQARGRVKLVPGMNDIKYTFYSGKWGYGLKVSQLTEVKNGSTLIEAGVDTADIPRSWADAAEMTRLLGFKYLWIDGLCLIGDEYESFAKGTAPAAEYAMGASLVIASADTEASQSFRSRKPLSGPYLRLSYTEGGQRGSPDQFISMRQPMIEAGSYLFASRWAKRGWTFLERYLTRRQLIFSNQQFYWNCNTCLLSESSRIAQDPLWRTPRCGVHLSSVRLSTFDRSVWYNLVEYYTATAILSLKSDKLKAIKQLADRLAGGDQYLMGIWANDIHNGIMWQPRTTPLSLDWCSFPSWCWASMDVPVQFSVARRRRMPGKQDATLVRMEHEASVPASSNVQTIMLEGWLLETKYELRDREARYEIWSRISRQDSGQMKGQTFCILLISQWRTTSWTGARWHGLVLTKEEKDGSVLFRRQGTYVGPFVSFESLGLSRRDFHQPDEQARFDQRNWDDLTAGDWRRERVAIA